MYSSTLSLTSAIDGVGGQRHASAALLPGKTRYLLYRRLGGPQSRSVRVRKISPPQGFNTRTVQPVVNRYADYPIPARDERNALHNDNNNNNNNRSIVRNFVNHK